MHLISVIDSSDTPGLVVVHEGVARAVTQPYTNAPVDMLKTSLSDLRAWVAEAMVDGDLVTIDAENMAPRQAPIWAAGVTYKRSQEARMEESTQADVYDRVYNADRPELFLKCTGQPVSDGGDITIRSDSSWDVPEPELTLAINHLGEIVAYGCGNDVSSRSIEGENPLYLPQAKIWEGSAALSATFRLNTADFDPLQCQVRLTITRDGQEAFAGETSTGMLHRSLPDLVTWLRKGNRFLDGVYLMTGTGIVPPDSFTLQAGDEVRIDIEGVASLVNTVKRFDVDTNQIG